MEIVLTTLPVCIHFPLSFFQISSVFCAFIPPIGTPAEVYSNGPQWFMSMIGFLAGIPLACFTFVPIFYKLRLTSVNEVGII
jgi:hypothetical protein